MWLPRTNLNILFPFRANVERYVSLKPIVRLCAEHERNAPCDEVFPAYCGQLTSARLVSYL